ncbi:carbohydrate kinase, partial [Candidatus Sumerlaeota bacterium]|nr:carbohydrate kinase [Candidatus Sumerlaeota bacterium]
MEQKTIVGLGEILWDLLPEGRLLGGAPANFAFHAAQLGERGVAVSRVGIDPLGDEIVARLQSLNLDPAHIQRDPYRPTGTVKVEIETGGQPRYTIVEDVAWDAIEWTPSLQALAERTEAVCFGSLAQRDSRSRATIIRFLESCPGDALRVFDINLRGHFFDAPTIGRGLEL